ncbi:hypothetical protein HDU77_004398 [Chytriomyces hyalinus]|nr:hypothetical protein HDU77_004398 [Chytriomyces hyalinus]
MVHWLKTVAVMAAMTVAARELPSKFVATMNAVETAQFVNSHLESISLDTFESRSDALRTADQEALRYNNVAPFLVERVSGSGSIRKVEEYIESVFNGLGWHVEKDSFEDKTPYGMKQFSNIIVTKNPKAKRRLVLAAHYDSKYFAEGGFIGATDSAVPCAILISIAKALNKQMDQLDANSRTTVQFIFFDGEEAFNTWTPTDSLYGSRHLAEKWENLRLDGTTSTNKKRTYLTAMDAFILLDLLGDSASKFVNLNHKTQWMWDRIVSIEHRLARMQLINEAKSNLINVQGETGYFEPGLSAFYHGIDDDHRPFQERGVPIVHVIAVPFPKTWHTMKDDGDHVDPEVGLDLTRIFAVLVAEYLGIV